MKYLYQFDSFLLSLMVMLVCAFSARTVSAGPHPQPHGTWRRADEK